ncbi:MAG TPA: hypothetical protein VJM08_11510 [Anaerolineales bacterium]|nr:hypothetical protein [Anaerolineales bacterium]
MEWMFVAVVAGTIFVLIRSIDFIKFKDPKPPEKPDKRPKNRNQLKD